MKTPYWIKAINRAERRGSFTLAEKDKADIWTTCACGEQDKRIPRDAGGAPIDKELSWFGGRFCDAVRFDEPARARELLAKIEERAAIVLRKVTK